MLRQTRQHQSQEVHDQYVVSPDARAFDLGGELVLRDLGSRSTLIATCRAEQEQRARLFAAVAKSNEIAARLQTVLQAAGAEPDYEQVHRYLRRSELAMERAREAFATAWQIRAF